MKRAGPHKVSRLRPEARRGRFGCRGLRAPLYARDVIGAARSLSSRAWRRPRAAGPERNVLAEPARRGEEYYGHARADVIEALARPLGAVLDVGCGSGGVGPGLRAAGATRIVGIEVEPSAARRAREIYDEVVIDSVEAALDSLTERFQTILCLDVLEHLVDPGAVLRALHAVAAPGCSLQVSVPNARHHSLVRDLVVRGTFGYTHAGHRDVTHLRWFTRRDMELLLEATGWRVEAVGNDDVGRGVLHRLTRGRLAEFIVGQWYLRARRADARDGRPG